MTSEKKKLFLILGASDAIVARLAQKSGADYIWASSFVLSSSLGFKDEGIVAISNYIPLLNGLIKASNAPVIMDLDIIGCNKKECLNNLHLLKKLSLGGVCIEDEGWPKYNAMLATSPRKLISAGQMSNKIAAARKILPPKCLIIARTHSLIANEPKAMLQERINSYTRAGADVICVHYVRKNWSIYNKAISELKINRPLMTILSKSMMLPKDLDYSKIKFVLFPNQLYRMMLHPVIKFCNKRNKKNYINFEKENLVDVDCIFKLVDEINTKQDE